MSRNASPARGAPYSPRRGPILCPCKRLDVEGKVERGETVSRLFDGYYLATRRGASDVEAYRNGVSVGTSSTASESLGSGNALLLSSNGAVASMPTCRRASAGRACGKPTSCSTLPAAPGR